MSATRAALSSGGRTRLVKAPDVSKGAWLLLPSGQHVEVFAVKGDRHPEVTLRYLDSDGKASAGCFVVSLTWLVNFAKKAL